MSTVYINSYRFGGTYAETLRDTYGASEVWPLVDIASGTAVPAFIDSARNGTLTGWDLQNAAGPVTGTLAPYLDGTNDYGSLYTASLGSAFSGAELSISNWIKAGAGVWTDGVQRMIWAISFAGHAMRLSKVANNVLQFQYRGTVNPDLNIGISTYDWAHVVIVISESNNYIRAFLNGSQVAASTPGTWSQALSIFTLGAFNTTPNFGWKGHLAYTTVKFGSIWSNTDITNIYNAAATAGPD